MGQLEAGIKLAPLLTEIKVDTSQFVKDMRDAGKEGEKEADKISKKMESTAKVGEKLSKVGSTLTKGLTLPIAGAAVATTKMAVDFESSFAKVSTLLDENRVDFGQYKNDILKASSESKVGVDEFSESVYNSISAGVDQTKAIQFTTEAMKLAKGGFTDGAKSVDILTTAINGYNLQAEDATRISDLLITTQNLGKTTVDELAVSMGTVIPVAKSSNFSIDELSASYAQLTKNGIATAESGTYLKAMLSELSKSGSITDKTLRRLTGKGFADLKKEGVSTSEILSMLDEEAKKNDKTLKDMFGSVEAGSAALVLYKGNGEEYNEMLSGMATSAGATQKAFEKIDATPAEQLKGSLNELRNAGIKFGASFVPMIDKVSKTLSKGADAFSNMSEEQQENIIKWGAVLATVGPVTKVMGSGISMYKNTATVLKEITGALGTVGGSTGVILKNWQVDRYITLYDAIMKFLNANGYRLQIESKKDGTDFGYVSIQAVPVKDYSDTVRYDQDCHVDFNIRDYRRGINHLVCAGEGQNEERVVLHLYVQKDGSVGKTKYYAGLLERTAVYDFSSADMEQLEEDGTKRLKELQNYKSIDVTVEDMELELGDIIGGREQVTGTEIKKPIVRKILKIKDGKAEVEYKVKGDE